LELKAVIRSSVLSPISRANCVGERRQCRWHSCGEVLCRKARNL